MQRFRLWQALKELWQALDSEEKDPAIRVLIDEAIACNSDWFGPPIDPAWRIEVFRLPREVSGISHGRLLRRYILILGKGCSTPDGLCNAIGHEMYHRVTVRRRDLYRPVWIDEMLACLAGGWFLQHKGFHEYAAYLHRRYCEQPGKVDVKRLRKARRKPGCIIFIQGGDGYPEGFGEGVTRLGYALLWIAGAQDLQRISKIKRLEDWIDSLPLENRYSACRVLQMPERDYPEPKTARHLVKLARALFDIGDWEAALAVLCEAHRLEPLNAEVLALLGYIYDRRKQPEKAIDAWLEAVRLDPMDGLTCQNLGHLFLEQKDDEKGIHWLMEAVRRNPGQALAYYYIGAVLHAKGERAAAREAWENALAADAEGYVGRWARKALEENPMPMEEEGS